MPLTILSPVRKQRATTINLSGFTVNTRTVNPENILYMKYMNGMFVMIGANSGGGTQRAYNVSDITNPNFPIVSNAILNTYVIGLGFSPSGTIVASSRASASGAEGNPYVSHDYGASWGRATVATSSSFPIIVWGLTTGGADGWMMSPGSNVATGLSTGAQRSVDNAATFKNTGTGFPAAANGGTYGMAYSPGSKKWFMQVGRTSYVSADAVTWTLSASSYPGTSVRSVKCVNDKFFIFDNSAGIVWTNDGVTINYASIPGGVSTGYRDIVYGNGMYIVVDTTTGNYAYSMDLQNWATGIFPTVNATVFKPIMNAMDYGNDQFVFMGANGKYLTYQY